MKFGGLIIKNNKKLLLTIVFLWVGFLVLTAFSISLSTDPIITKEDFLAESLHPMSIFVHNLLSAFFLILLGNLTLGLYAIYALLLNKYITSYAIYFVYTETGMFSYAFAIILIHGILEIPAICLCFLLSSFTLRLSLNKIFGHHVFHMNSANEKVALVLLMIVLYFIASIVEAYMTPALSGTMYQIL